MGKSQEDMQTCKPFPHDFWKVPFDSVPDATTTDTVTLADADSVFVEAGTLDFTKH